MVLEEIDWAFQGSTIGLDIVSCPILGGLQHDYAGGGGIDLGLARMAHEGKSPPRSSQQDEEVGGRYGR